VNPAGNLDVDVFRHIARGEAVELPNLGMETLHHVHAEDVARLFVAAMNHPSVANGESFHAVSPGALTTRGYAEAMYRWWGHEPRVRLAPWEEWKKTVAPTEAERTWDHIAHSPCCSMEKARRLLGFVPKHRSLAAVREAVTWLEHHDWKPG
jgi:nucleoside-diphosphate-sugar epimerase